MFKKRKNKKEKKEGKKLKIGKSMADVLNGNILYGENVIKSLPFMFFLTGVMICYIWYGYYTDNTLRNNAKKEADLKELYSEYISVQERLNQISRQSQVAEATKSIGLKESLEPPFKITVKRNQLQQ